MFRVHFYYEPAQPMLKLISVEMFRVHFYYEPAQPMLKLISV